MPKGCMTVFTSCTDPKRDEEFNRWYSHTHIPDLLHAKSCIGARRYKEAREGQPVRYMALYELDCFDLSVAREEIVSLATRAFELGRHIECIARSPSSEYLMMWEEIPSDAYRPLETVDYSRDDPAIGASLTASF